MIKRTIDISQASYLKTVNQQLVVEQNREVVGQIPIEDIGILLLDHPAIVVTQQTILSCQKNNIAIIFCNEKHLPYSIALPISEGHTLHSKILHTQIKISESRRKQLWKQIIQCKIDNQIETLQMAGKNKSPLMGMRKKVKSGDSTNCEAEAARYYWKTLFGASFRRNQEAEGINALLNYGYAVVRALVARAIVCAGLHPTLGLHHKNQYNPFCLADDLMEPLRSWVDWEVFQISKSQKNPAIEKETKAALLALLAKKVIWNNQVTDLMVATHHFMANFREAYSVKTVKIYYPARICNSED